MKSSQSLLVQVAQADGRRLQLEVDAAVAQLGRGAHCEVQLSDPKVLPTHLELAARDGVVFARPTLTDAAVWVDGRRFHGGAVPAGATLRVGDTELRVSLRDSGSRMLRVRRAQRSAVLGLLVLLVSIAAARLWSVENPDQSSRLDARAWPALLEPGGQLECPERDPEPATGLARNAEQAARALRERMPFFPGDALRAVVSLEHAAACYGHAGLRAEADEARRLAAALEEQVVADYRAHGVGLGWAMRGENWAAVRRHAGVLLALTTVSFGATDPLVEWLGQLLHRAEQNTTARAPRD
jgi:hypothetical protein